MTATIITSIAAEPVSVATPPVRTDAERAMNELAEHVLNELYMVEQDVGESQNRTVMRKDNSQRHRMSVAQEKRADGYFQTIIVSYGYRKDADGPETYCESIRLDEMGGLEYSLVTNIDGVPKDITIKPDAAAKLDETAFTRSVKVKSFWSSLTGNKVMCKQGSFHSDHLYNIAQALDGKEVEGLFAENIDAEEVTDIYYGPMPILS